MKELSTKSEVPLVEIKKKAHFIGGLKEDGDNRLHYDSLTGGCGKLT